MSATLGVIATAYGMAAAASSLLQARRMHRRRTSADISLGFLSSYIGGYGIWLTYGLSIGSLPLIVVDAVGLLCGGTTLFIALRLRPRRPRGKRHVGIAAVERRVQRRAARRPRSCAPASSPTRNHLRAVDRDVGGGPAADRH
jgi:uncharacterized protein with PQ loop repeat